MSEIFQEVSNFLLSENITLCFFCWFTFSFGEKRGQNIESANGKQGKKQNNRRFGVKRKTESDVL